MLGKRLDRLQGMCQRTQRALLHAVFRFCSAAGTLCVYVSTSCQHNACSRGQQKTVLGSALAERSASPAQHQSNVRQRSRPTTHVHSPQMLGGRHSLCPWHWQVRSHARVQPLAGCMQYSHAMPATLSHTTSTMLQLRAARCCGPASQHQRLLLPIGSRTPSYCLTSLESAMFCVPHASLRTAICQWWHPRSIRLSSERQAGVRITSGTSTHSANMHLLFTCRCPHPGGLVSTDVIVHIRLCSGSTAFETSIHAHVSLVQDRGGVHFSLPLPVACRCCGRLRILCCLTSVYV
jgi:hypothetical protein